MTINFCFDKILDHTQKIVLPNLCGLDYNITVEDFKLKRGSLSSQFPYCDYPRLLDYAASEMVEFSISTVDQAPLDSFYLVNINFFLTDFDYFSRLKSDTLSALQQKKIRLLFYYCEADAPDRLQQRFQELCNIYKIPIEQFYFISHNTRAKNLKNWYYFNDDEMLYNRTCKQYLSTTPGGWHNQTRLYKTTALVRTHKNWRAVFCGQLYRMKWPDHSLFSYCGHNIEYDHDLLDSPYKPELNKLSARTVRNIDNTWLTDAEKLLASSPITIDELDNATRTQYRTFNPDHFYNAYWNIVIETHIDVENIPGVFITEKTWKPIAHYQPFIILGCSGSLAHLHELGYQTFGEFIDESYDSVTDHIERTYKVLDLCKKLAQMSHDQLQKLNQRIKPILEHNRKLLWDSKSIRIQTLFNQLIGKHD